MRPLSVVRSLQGNKIGAAIAELHRSENDLAQALLGLADQHKVDHEVFYVARDIAGWSHEHVRRLAEVGRPYDLDLDPQPAAHSTVVATIRQKGAELTGRHHEPALLLIAGLRRVHTMAAGVSLDWEVLAQAAQAVKDDDLSGLARDSHPQTLRQLRWANSQVKVTSAQVMVTG